MIGSSFLLKIERVLVLTGILVFFILSVLHWDFLFVSNVDIYQYLCDARIYYQGGFPQYVQPQPLYSLLIFPFSILFSSFTFPELKAGIAINLISNTMALYLTWLLSKRYLTVIWRLLLMILLLAHPLIFFTAVNTTSEPLLWLFVTSALYFYPSKPNIGYLFAVIAAFAKYEGFAILGMLLITDGLVFFQLKKSGQSLVAKLKRIFSSRVLALMSIGCLLIWQATTFSYNYDARGSANFYFEEIQQSNKHFLDWRESSRIIDLLLADSDLYSSEYVKNNFFEVLILLSLFTIIGFKSYQKKEWPLFQSVGFCLGYLVIHMIFPAYEVRYFMPILGFIFLYICITFQWIAHQFKNSNLFLSLIALALVAGWLYDLRHYKYSDFLEQSRYPDAEERLAGEWLNAFSYERKEYAVLAESAQRISSHLDESNIKNPFKHGILNRPLCDGNPNSVESNGAIITFYNSSLLGPSDCRTPSCLVRFLPYTYEKVFVVNTEFDAFKMNENEIEIGSEGICFKKLVSLNDDDLFNPGFVEIYEYQKDVCN